tara:strand:- start:6266 stop:7186 length:921 start_codon:yes stop_codon:yes gene_type:complete
MSIYFYLVLLLIISLVLISIIILLKLKKLTSDKKIYLTHKDTIPDFVINNRKKLTSNKTIYLTHKDNIPDFVINNWKKLNPDYNIKYYNDNDCKEFIKNNYPKSYLDYFNRLCLYANAGPIKSDFWRCLILYKYGGIYADCDIEPIVPIDDFLEKDVNFLTCLAGYTKPGKTQLNPHFIYVANEKDKILELCIECYKDYLFNADYEYWKHSICYVMLYIFNLYQIYYKENQIIYNTNLIPNNIYKIQLIQEVFPDIRRSLGPDVYCTYKNKKILYNRHPEYDRRSHKYKSNISKYRGSYPDSNSPF